MLKTDAADSFFCVQVPTVTDSGGDAHRRAGPAATDLPSIPAATVMCRNAHGPTTASYRCHSIAGYSGRNTEYLRQPHCLAPHPKFATRKLSIPQKDGER